MSSSRKSRTERSACDEETLVLNEAVVAQLAAALGLPASAEAARGILAYASGEDATIGKAGATYYYNGISFGDRNELVANPALPDTITDDNAMRVAFTASEAMTLNNLAYTYDPTPGKYDGQDTVYLQGCVFIAQANTNQFQRAGNVVQTAPFTIDNTDILTVSGPLGAIPVAIGQQVLLLFRLINAAGSFAVDGQTNPFLGASISYTLS